MEEWKDIKGYEGLYQVSNLGRVKSLERDVIYKNGKIYHYEEKILNSIKNNSGYFHVSLYKENKKKVYGIHRLVAEAFIPNPENKETVDHINTIRTDNRIENLRWFTYREQMVDNEITKEKRKKADKEHGKKMCKKVINLDTNEIFESAKEAAIKYNLYSSSSITACCKGKQKTVKRCRWAYYNEEE